MTPNDLNILIQEGEGTTLEFKENFSSSFARELVALANTIGGKILLGVRDDGTVIGVHDSNALRARIQDIARNCDPPVKVLTEPVGGVLAVHRIGFIEKAGTGIRRIRDEAGSYTVRNRKFEAIWLQSLSSSGRILQVEDGTEERPRVESPRKSPRKSSATLVSSEVATEVRLRFFPQAISGK